MTDDLLSELIELTKNIQMTDQQKEVQRRCFVYGNLSIENDKVTREMVNAVSESTDASEAEFPSPYGCYSKELQAFQIAKRFGIDADGEAWLVKHLEWAEERATEACHDSEAYWSSSLE